MDEFATKKPKKQTKSPAVEDAAAKKTNFLPKLAN